MADQSKTCGTCARVVEPWHTLEKSCLSCVRQNHEKCMMRGSTEPCERYSTRSSVCFIGPFSYCVLPDDVEGIIRERNVRENEQACHNYLAKKTCRTCAHAGCDEGWEMIQEECRSCVHDNGVCTDPRCSKSNQTFEKICGHEKCHEYERSDFNEYGSCWLDRSRFVIVTADHVCEHFEPESELCFPYSKESEDRELVIEREPEQVASEAVPVDGQLELAL